jgi:hypothetical protein
MVKVKLNLSVDPEIQEVDLVAYIYKKRDITCGFVPLSYTPTLSLIYVLLLACHIYSSGISGF